MNEFDILKMFFKTPKDYIKDMKNSIKPKEAEDAERYRADEVKDEEMFDPDQVSKCDDIDSHVWCMCLMLTKKPMVWGAKCSAIAWQKWVKEYKDKDARWPIWRAEKGFHWSLEQAIKQEDSILMKWKYKDWDAELTIKKFYDHLSKWAHAPYRWAEFPECKAIIKRKDVHSHKMEWGYWKVRCRYFHSHLLYRVDLENHEQNEWEFKTLICKGWMKSFYKSALQKHIESCNLYPIKCQNCNENVKREDLEIHGDHWPKVLIPWLGYKLCKFQTSRDKLEDHQKQCEGVYYTHLEIIQDYKDQLDAKNELIQMLNESANKSKGVFGSWFHS